MPNLTTTINGVPANDTANNTANDGPSPALAAVAQALRGLRFGTVTIVVQDGVIVQIERTEKTRLTPPPPVRKVR